MLFSNSDVASFINANFEPAWESVRPVPIVHVDFGNEVAVTRTLHGNVATYVCNAEGNVLDILPGAYDAATYLAQLEQLSLLNRWIAQSDQPLVQLREYHTDRQRAPDEATTPKRFRSSGAEPKVQPAARIADFSKTIRIERPIEVVLQRVSRKAEVIYARDTSDGKDAMQASLERDAIYNELFRRRKIHEHLARAGWAAPPTVTKWLYREVLNSDLDDPYLGLKELLFADYPLMDEANEGRDDELLLE